MRERKGAVHADVAPSMADRAPTSCLEASDFDDFFTALHDRPPFPWQSRLAHRVVEKGWPRYLQLPTASGKTAALDIAVFHLAVDASRMAETGKKPTAARRIFFVVDRRIVVNEAFLRMRDAPEDESSEKGVAGKLNDALNVDSGSVLAVAARWLRWLANERDEAHPVALDAVELRGAIYRDDGWVRSPLQPTVVTSTVDQVGSRMLFRGYGVSNASLPIHAALTTRDTLMILDEAHCSRPFAQTVQSIRDLCRMSEGDDRSGDGPRLVEMTATPDAADEEDAIFSLEPELDYKEGSALARRHGAAKPIRLIASPAKGANPFERLAKDLVEAALDLAYPVDETKEPCRRIAIVVNRVALARLAHKALKEAVEARHKKAGDPKNAPPVDLMIGAMRPLDRDRLTARLREDFGSGRADSSDELRFLVSTQCIEVGADLDFDGMVCQCASLDAIRQRFGRLNRLGDDPQTRGVVVMADADLKAKEPDPIYGTAAVATWNWLLSQTNDGEDAIDFGVRAFGELWKVATDDSDLAERLSVALTEAPALMPSHVDLLSQTNPRPSLEPDVSLYLHGAGRGRPEVRVCWRADLLPPNERPDWHPGGEKPSVAAEVLAAVRALPPTSAECLTVPVSAFRRWLRGETEQGVSIALGGDVEGEAWDDQAAETKGRRTLRRWAVTFRGRDDIDIVHADVPRRALRLPPGCTVVVPVEQGGWETLGHLPDAPREALVEDLLPSADRPEELEESDAPGESGAPDEPETSDETRQGRTQGARRRLARLDVAEPAFEQARARRCVRAHPHLALSTAHGKALKALRNELDRAREAGKEPSSETVRNVIVSASGRKGSTELEPLSEWRIDGRSYSLVLVSPRRPPNRRHQPDPFEELSVPLETASGRRRLPSHTADVVAELRRSLEAVDESSDTAATLAEAAARHDWGKADPRFQAELLGLLPMFAAAQRTLWAKGPDDSPWPRRADDGVLPSGFRHEAVSVELSNAADGSAADPSRTLLRHLLRSHHGYARPLLSPWDDPSPPAIDLEPIGVPVALTAEDRERNAPPWRLDSGACDDFWNATRGHGWWRLAWLESLLRLADWKASAAPGSGESGGERSAPDVRTSTPTSAAAAPALTKVPLPGPDGTNPLGFLSGLGLFRLLALSRDGVLRLAWSRNEAGGWMPVLHTDDPSIADPEALLETLTDLTKEAAEDHPLSRLLAIDEDRLRASGNSVYREVVRPGSNEADLAKWLAANGSDLADPSRNSQLQTARRDYFAGNVKAVIEATTRDHLRRTLFEIWDYADSIEKVSLHLEPREDRRHATQWHQPAGDPSRKRAGGMIGANRLAMEAWPLFPALPVFDRDEVFLQSLGFRGHRMNDTRWVYPLWSAPVGLDGVTTVLGLRELFELRRPKRGEDADGTERRARAVASLRARGVASVRSIDRLTVGKTPNFTTSTALL